MKMDKKLKLRGGELNSPDPAGGFRPPFRLDPIFGQILDPPLHVGSGSEVPEAEHNENFFQHWNFLGGCPLVSFPTPLVISIAIVSSIAILLLDTYRGRNFRYRPALLR